MFNFFSPSCSQTILVFPYQTSWQYSDKDPLTGVSNAGEVGTNCDSIQTAGYRLMTAGHASGMPSVCPEKSEPPKHFALTSANMPHIE